MYLTARLAMAFLLLAIWLRPDPGGQESAAASRLAKWTWTLGCLMLWVHVAWAFHWEHHWSHEAAYRATAERTEAVVGWYWGGGVYVNYITLLLWTGDVLMDWAWPGRPGRLVIGWRRLVWGYLLMMGFQASVVFAEGHARWVALGVWIMVGWGVWRRRVE